MTAISSRAPRRYVVTGAVIVSAITWFLWTSANSTAVRNRNAAILDGGTSTTARPKPCMSLPGANDTLVVMKTGSTEIRDKLPVHLATTLRCYPNYIIFSDVEDPFMGEQILDALEDVNSKYKEGHDDFELYRRLQQHGRAALHPSELSGPVSQSQRGSGKPANPGWRLDKWKFLPMMRRTLDLYPDKKWYLFVEADTYVFWKTLLAYLAVLDWTKPYYVGSQINIGDIEFAHGGSGILASRHAMELVVQHYIAYKTQWEEFTKGHWAGDCVLGKAFKDAGVPITRAWPIFQGDDIGEMNYGRTDNSHRLWCHPTVSYHHLAPSVVKELWDFEQTWMRGEGQDPASFLRHKDVFATHVMPRTLRPRSDWNNHCEQDQGPVSSLEECRTACEKDVKCMQFVVDSDGRCYTSARPNLGGAQRGFDSGWMHDRMQAFYDSEDACTDEGWIS